MNDSILPHHAYPFDDEFAASLLLRTSYINGYKNPKMMLNNFGIPVYKSTIESILCSEKKFSEILNILHLPNIFSSTVIKKLPPTNQFFYITDNIVISKKLIDINLNKFCPKCLIELGYWRKEWLLKPMYICNTHKIKMINNCPKCNQILQLNRTSLFICSNCNYDLRNTEQVKTQLNEIVISEWLSITLKNNLFNNEYLIVWEAIQLYFENIQIKAPNSVISDLCYLFLEKRNSFLVIMIENINKYKNLGHPIIQVLHFLKIKGPLQDIAKEILNQISNPISNSENLVIRNLSSHEVSLALGIENKKFNKKIKNKTLTHEELKLNNKPNFNTKILEDWLIYPNKYLTNKVKCRDNKSNDFLDIYEVCTYLNINQDTARKFFKNQHLNTKKMHFNGIFKTCISKKFIESFNKKFIFLSCLAKQLNTAPTYIQDKLLGLGVKPIHDGKKTTLYYLRDDIKHVTKEQLDAVKFNLNKRGRKLLCDKKIVHKEGLSLLEASKILGISPLQVAKLIHYKFLPVKDIQLRPHIIYKEDVLLFLDKVNDPSYISLSNALKILNCTYSEFEKRWVMTGLAEIRNLRYWKSVHISQINEIKEISNNYFTAKEANKILGMHRTYITNLVTMNVISPRIIGNGIHNIRLFKKSEVIALIQKGFGKTSLISP